VGHRRGVFAGLNSVSKLLLVVFALGFLVQLAEFSRESLV